MQPCGKLISGGGANELWYLPPECNGSRQDNTDADARETHVCRTHCTGAGLPELRRGLDEAVTVRLLHEAEELAHAGAQLDVREYAA